MSKLYKEDFKAAINLNKKYSTEVVSNLFRFNKKQTEILKGNKIGKFNSINQKSTKFQSNRKRNLSMTPRMIEVAATLSHFMVTQQEIAEVFNCTQQTVSKALLGYHGYQKLK